ncbi:hypothetical protein IWQ61_003460 [Dispira simplex]|nr:hypothetical protein IWQ61_003460 [Dispira simplex]
MSRHPTEENPFSDARYEMHDPFADPTITRALSSTHIAADDALGHSPGGGGSGADPSRVRKDSQRMDFIPLDDDRHSVDVGTSRRPSTHPHQQLSSREAELHRREEELARRERELQAQSEEIRKSGRPANNFPPFYPLIYLDIDVEIPEAHRPMVRRLWYFWLYTECNLILNCVAALIMLVSHASGVTSAPTDFGVSFSYLFTITLGSFFLWYRPVYNAYMKEKSLYYYFYFVFAGLHILFAFYMAVGIPYSGSAGLINAISMLSGGAVVAGVFCLIDTVCWVVGGLFLLFMYQRVHKHYKTQGHTFEEAKAQAVSSVASSKTARQAATSYATSQMQSRV